MRLKTYPRGIGFFLTIILPFLFQTIVNAQVITGVTVQAGDYKVNDAVPIVITSDVAGYTLDPSDFNAFPLISFADLGGGEYFAEYIVVDGGLDHAAVGTIPMNITLNDGTPGTTFTGPATSGGTVTIDSNLPTIASVSIPDVSMVVGDVVTATITVGDDGGDLSYTLTSGAIGGFTLGSFNRTNSTTYTATFTIANGGTDVAAGSNIPITNLVITDGAGNPSTAFTTAISQTSDDIDANIPNITNVSIPDVAMLVGDVVTATITVDDDLGDSFTLNASNIGGFTLGSLSRTNITTYTATFTIANGGTDVAAGSDIPVDITLADGSANAGNNFTTAISQTSDPIDANIPNITAVSIPDVDMFIGDVVTATITVDDDKGDNYTLNASTIGGFTLGSLSRSSNTTYTATFTITNGGADVLAAADIPVDITLADSDANDGNNFTSSISQGSDPIDANGPTITSVVIANAAMMIDDVVSVTINTNNDGGVAFTLTSGTIGGYTLANFNRSNATTYTAQFTVIESGTDVVAANDIPVSILLSDSDPSPGTLFTTPISQTSDPIDANRPVISTVSIPDATMLVTDVVTVTITVPDDLGDTYTLSSGSIGLYTLASFTRSNNTTYTATFTIIDGGTDVPAGDDFPVSVTILDGVGNASLEFTTPISQASDPIDANLPTISSVSIPNSGMVVGDVVTVTFTVGDDNGVTYTLTSGAISGFTLGSFSKSDNTTYTATFTITDGGTDVAAGDDIPVTNLVISDPLGNPSATFTTPISQGSDPLDANIPTITNVTIPDVAMLVGDVVTATITVDDDLGDTFTLNASTIGGFTLGSLSRTNSTTYTATFTIANGGTDVAAGSDIPVDVTLADSDANAGNNFTTAISQTSDPIDANIPNITNVTIPNVAMVIGDVVTATITVDDDKGDNYTLNASTIGGFTLGSLSRSSNTTYTATFTITNGGTDVAAGVDIPVDVTLADSDTNAGNNFTTAISQGSDPVDANGPDITNVTIPNAAMIVGDQVSVTITVTSSAEAYTLASSTINGFTLINLFKFDNTTYFAKFDVVDGGTDVAAGSDISVDVTLNGTDGNPGNNYTTAISQAADPIDANLPVISSVTIPDATMLVTDIVTATITVTDDGGDTYTLSSGNIGGFTLGSFSRTNNTTYTADFTVTDGGADVAAGTNIPMSLIILDGASNPSADFTTAISQGSDPIDANLPTISNVSIPDVSMVAGDVVTATFTVGNDGGDNYTLTSGAIGGFTLGSFSRTNSTTYTATFTIANGGTDVAAGSNIPVTSLVISDGLGNPSTTFTTPISQASDDIDANIPTITNITIPNSAMLVDDIVTATITVDDDKGDLFVISSGTIGGFTMGGLIRTNNTTYTATFTIANGGTDVAAGSDIPVNVTLADGTANDGNNFTTAISQAADPIDANIPNITNVSIPNVAMEVGDVVTATITVDDDKGDVYTLNASTIGGFTLSSLSRSGNTTYTATFTISNGGTNVIAGNDIPVDITLSDTDANAGNNFTTAISQGSDPIDANGPNITNVTIPNAAMKVGDVVTATITVDDDGGVTFTLTSGTIGGFTLGSLSRTNNTTYTATFTVTDLGTDVAAGTDIPVTNVVLSDLDPSPGNSYNTPISQASDPIDANLPIISSVSIPNSTMLVTDVVTATITVADDGGDTYTLSSGNIGGFTLGSFSRTNNTTYTATFTITDGGTDVAAGSDIPMSLIILDGASNPSADFTTAISQGSDPIDANLPVISNISIPNVAMFIGDIVTATITVTDDGGDTYNMTGGNVGGFTLGSFSRVNNTTYTATFSITNGGTDVIAANDIPVSLDIEDGLTNPSVTFVTPISQISDPIDANGPNITNVTIPNVSMKVTDVVTATITVDDDGGDTYTLTSGTIGGFTLGSLSRSSNTTYTATFTITDLGTDVVAGNDIPITNLLLSDTDPSPGTVFNGVISQNSDPIDANIPDAPILKPNLQTASDVGQSSTDDITNITSPTFDGSGVEPNATLELVSSVTGAYATTATITGGGAWTLQVNPTEAVHNLTARVIDAAGNVSPESPILAFRLDVTAPFVTAAPLVELGGTNSGKPLTEPDSLFIFFSEQIGLSNNTTVRNVDANTDGIEIDDPNTDGLSSADTDEAVGSAVYHDNGTNLVNVLILTGGTDSWPRWDHVDEAEADETPSGIFYVQVGGAGANNSAGGIYDVAGNEMAALGATGDSNGAGTPGGWVLDLTVANGDATQPEISGGPIFFENGTNPEQVFIALTEPLNLTDGQAITPLNEFQVQPGGGLNIVFYDSATVSIVYESVSNGQWSPANQRFSFTPTGATNAKDGGGNIVERFTDEFPTLSNVVVSTNNANFTNRAKSGDVMTINFQSSVNIQVDSVIFDATKTRVKNLTASEGPANTWVVQHTFTGSETGDTTNFEIWTTEPGHFDPFSNSQPLVTTIPVTTNGSLILYDNAVPSLPTVTMLSSTFTSGDATLDSAKLGDNLRILFTADDGLYNNLVTTPSVTVGGNAAFVTALDAVGLSWRADITLSGGNEPATDGDFPGSGDFAIVINFQDSTGNAGTTVTTVTDGTNVTFDNTPPTVTSIVLASTTNGIGSTNGIVATSVDWDVTFSEDVDGVDVSDFDITTSGFAGDADYPLVTGNISNVVRTGGNTFTVTVNTIAGTGTLRLDFTDDDTVLDYANNPTGGTGVNANFTTGQSYSIVLPQPSDHVTSFGSSNITTTKIQLDWSNNTSPTQKATHYLIIANNPAGSLTAPTDANFVAEDLLFVDDDGADSVAVDFITVPATQFVAWSGLVSGTVYDFEIYPFALSPNNSNDNINFKTDGTIPSHSVPTDVGVLSTITAGIATEPDTLSSLATQLSTAVAPQLNAVLNFDFTILDDGGTPGIDNVDTKITQMVFNADGASGNTIADWTQAIAGAELSDNLANKLELTPGSDITATTLTFPSIPFAPGNLGHIGDNLPKTYTLKIWLKTDLSGLEDLPLNIDGKRFVFKVTDTDFTYDNNTVQSSKILGSETENSGSTKNLVSVTGKKLVFTNQPNANIGVGADFFLADIPQVTSFDHNNNIDLGFTQSVTVTNTDNILMDNAPTTDFATTSTPGIIDFPANFSYKYSGNGALTIASLNLTSATSTGVTVHVSNTTSLNAGVGAEPSTISSLINNITAATTGDAGMVFDFSIIDDDGIGVNVNDTIATQITQVIIRRHTSDQTIPFGTWVDLLGDAAIDDGSGTFVGATSINADNIVFDLTVSPGDVGYVADGATKNYKVYMYFNTAMGGTLPDNVDNLKPLFEVSETDFTVVPADISVPGSSTLAATQNTNSGAGNNAIDVIATQISFINQPISTDEFLVDVDFSDQVADVAASPFPKVEAQDANLNRDLDYVDVAVVADNDFIVSGTPLNITTDATPTFIAGILTFPNTFQYNNIGTAQINVDVTAGAVGSSFVTKDINSNTFIIRVGGASLILDGAAEQNTISSIVVDPDGLTPPASGETVLEFDIKDDGGATNPTDDENDGRGSLIEQMTFTMGTQFNFIPDWTLAIQGAELFDNDGNSIVATVNPTTIAVTGMVADVNNPQATDLGFIVDDATKNYTLKVWFKDSVDWRLGQYNTLFPGSLTEDLDGSLALNGSEDRDGDGILDVADTLFDAKAFEFVIDEVDIVTNALGSSITAGEISTSGVDKNVVTVVATDIDFVEEPPLSASINTPVTPIIRTDARDIYDNIDRDFDFVLDSDVVTTGTPTLTLQDHPLGSNGPTDQFADGVFFWNPTFIYIDETNNFPTDHGELELVANGITATSSSINVLAAFDSWVAREPNGGTLQANIIPVDLDATDVVNGANDVELARFRLWDGQPSNQGGGFDIDGAKTVLTDLTFTITNWENLRRVALYTDDGLGNFTEIGTEIDAVANASNTFVFSKVDATGLVVSDDDATKLFTIRASFLDIYDDNEQLFVEITVAENNFGGSQFQDLLDMTSEPLPTTDPLLNYVEVTATQFDIIIQPNFTEGIFIAIQDPQLEANDAKGNLDVDFNWPVVINRTGLTANVGMQSIPAKFSNITPGILDFPLFQYTQTGDGQLTVTVNGLPTTNWTNDPLLSAVPNGPYPAASTITNTTTAVDVIHTTFKNLDLGQNVDIANNGIEPRASVPAGGFDLAFLGFEVTTQQTLPKPFPSEPTLNSLIIRFGNTVTPLSSILNSIRIFRSTDSFFDINDDFNISLNPAVSIIVGFDSIFVDGIGDLITDDPANRYYFLVADVDPTASSSTDAITPTIVANGDARFYTIPDNEDVLMTSGSVETSSNPAIQTHLTAADANKIRGRTYGFDDFNPPVIISRHPFRGDTNFPRKDSIVVVFNELVQLVGDSTIQIFDKKLNVLAATYKVTSSTNSTTFVYKPLTTADSLDGDVRYFVRMSGDQYNDSATPTPNFFVGITSAFEWQFKTSDVVPPVFNKLSKPPELLNITDIGFDIRFQMDEIGRVYFAVVDAINQTPPPTAKEIKDGTYPNTLLYDSIEVVKANEYHYKIFYDQSLFPTTSGDFQVYIVAQDISLPFPNLQADTAFHTFPITSFGSPLAPGVNVLNVPVADPNQSNDICIGDPQPLLAPIQFAEGVNNDFVSGTGQTLNLLISDNFIFNTDAEADTVFGIGNDISNVTFSYLNNTIFQVRFDIDATPNWVDKLVISGIEFIAEGDVDSTASILRFSGTAFNTIIDGATIALLNTVRIDSISWITEFNRTSVGDNIPKVALFPDPTNSLADDGTNLFNGPGVFNDTLFTAAAGLGLHSIVLTHTDEFGCVTNYTQDINIFDNERAIVGLEPIYCTDDLNEGGSTSFVIPRNGRAPDFILVALSVQTDEDDSLSFSINNSIVTDVTPSLTQPSIPAGDWIFDPSIFSDTVNFSKFTNEGGLLGELVFSGVYQNQKNTTLFDTLQQLVKIYIPPSNSIGFTSARLGNIAPFGGRADILGGIASLPLDTPLEYCEDDGVIDLNGLPNPSTGSSIGFFTVNELADSLFIGLSDNGDGSGALNTQSISDATGFGDYEIKYIFSIDESGCNDTIAKTIRINPKPRSNFSWSLLCEDTPIDFTELAGYTQADSISINNSDPAKNAIFPQIIQWKWNFNDQFATASENLITRDQTNKDSVVHTFRDPGVYLVDLDILTEFGCVATKTIQIVIGGIPGGGFLDFRSVDVADTLGFDFSGTGVNDSILFMSTTGVFNNPVNSLLIHSTDRLIWDFGDGSSVTSDDNDPTAENRLITAHKYAVPGFYDVNLTLISTVGCSDSTSNEIVVLARETPDEQISYIATFEGDSADWIDLPEIGTTSNTWIWGSPSKTTIVPEFDQGDNVWITGLNSSYAPNERSYVYSPSFDLSNLQRPMLSIDINRQLELGDGVIVEFSKDSLNIMDSRKVWITLGGVDTGFEWYDNSGLPGAPGNDASQAGWELSSSGWVSAKHTLSDAFSETRIVLRIGLGSENDNPNADGFAFDNVRIGERTRTVLVESFTNTSIVQMEDGVNIVVIENDSINNFNANDLELVKLEYHTDFPGPDPLNNDNPSVPSARSVFYGITENIPTARMDGLIPVAEPDDVRFSKWGRDFFTKQTLKLAEFKIVLTVDPLASGDININATLTAIDSIDANTIVHTVIVEQFVTADQVDKNDEIKVLTGELGSDSWKFVVKQMLPSSSGNKFIDPIPQGESITISEVWQPAAIYNPNDLSVIVFAQNEDDRRVYQSARVDFIAAIVTALEEDLDKDGLALYPNPASDYAMLFFKKRIDKRTTIRVYDQFGRVADYVEVPYGTKQVKLETNKYSSGLFIVQIQQEGKPIIHKKLLITH